MAEYIERAVCLSILRAKANMAVLMDAAPYFEKAAQMLEKLPTADVSPVVRCKDCKYNRGSKKCLNPDSFFAVPKDDDFCSYGERKEEPHDRL